MPPDFIAISKTGDTMRYYIPNTWFEKKVNPDPPVNERLNRLALENECITCLDRLGQTQSNPHS